MAGNLLGCNLDALKAAAACFMPQCLGETDRQALDILVRVKALAAEGGTDYSGNLAALDQAAARWSILSESERKALIVYIDLENALGEGATFPGGTGINNLKALSRCYSCIGENRRKGILLFLKCQLASLEISEGP